ncbi:hypothetical protein [Pseudovibrio sp. Tun.PSC04-5.I4]|uniref:hypothetical protein n=1 Tax=Pseudovibrio sp. Tun.PSC04-5.I4 TaxID=1798213 RepID=UPI0008823A13|nr:hypothetical protein [Pseudovibrio sp. Tun.PSC04-5.I4]SDR22096.1 hypothetical protein SAMN04515695_3514 [Pseudovibrio sp. Tun.PSC04-5.I4]
MPVKKLTPEQHQWAQKIYKHLQWKFPIAEEAPSEEAELENVLLDDVSRANGESW